MAESDFLRSYPMHVARLQAAIVGDAALEAAVGGDFITVGKIELSLLRSIGLSEGHFLVDVGCGSGRLAFQLTSIKNLIYLGTDVVPALLAHAKQLTQQPQWRFELTDGVRIPCASESADYVCFFSVFTHLRHEETYKYLEEAKRVLKPGGRVVFSVLEFLIFSHWAVFQNSLKNSGPDDCISQFMDRHAIRLFAHHLGLNIDFVADGDKPHIPVEDELLRWSNGGFTAGLGALGQSVAVLSKPRA